MPGLEETKTSWNSSANLFTVSNFITFLPSSFSAYFANDLYKASETFIVSVYSDLPNFIMSPPNDAIVCSGARLLSALSKNCLIPSCVPSPALLKGVPTYGKTPKTFE